MKKTLIALAVAASAAVSGTAYAWTSGEFKDSFGVGGTITATTYSDKWEWKIGDGLSFDRELNEMSGDSKILTITQPDNVAILLGRTKEAFTASGVGVGAIPLLSFSDYNGDAVELKSSDTAGQGYFTLPMKDALGSIQVNVTAAGLWAYPNNDYLQLRALTAANDTNIFYGGLVSTAVTGGTAAASTINSFGGANNTALLTQVMNAGASDLISKGQMTASASTTTNMVNDSGRVMAASYALGIASGQKITATFTSPVTKTTQWNAPLNIAVTYN